MFNKTFEITEQNAAEYVKIIGNFIRGKVDEAKRSGVVLGISGGIDSAVVARLCQEAGIKTTLVLLPDGDTMDKSKSTQDAMSVVNTFSFDYRVVNIGEACKQVEGAIGMEISDFAKINIRPRIRMTVLYSIAQTMGAFVIGTGNLAERVVGYFTKWGDGANDINPLGMLTKKEVRILAKELNVPDQIITKPPSANLFEGQTDENELGFTYEQIDKFILEKSSGDADVDQRLRERMEVTEHKNSPIPIFEG
ncbi:MAG: NAD(+) synthase [Bacillota bacterium]|nr:NAD(+) synthase [Bacillota bacterium]